MSKTRHLWVIAAALAVYLFFSLAYLELPGLENDETIFVNPAMGMVRDGTAIAWNARIGSIKVPVMIMRYIGAVKSYVYAPIFALFGPGVPTVRIPVVLFGLLTLGFTYAAARNLFGREVALLSLFLLAADPSFIFANRLDWGPVCLMMVFKTASLLLLLRWLRNGRPYLLAAAALIMGIGLFDKVVFIWYIAAAALAFPICYWRKIKPLLTGRVLVLTLVSFLIGCGPLILYNVRFPLMTFIGQKPVANPVSYEIAYRSRLFCHTLRGSEILLMLNEQPPQEVAATYRHPAAGGFDRAITAFLGLFPVQKSLTPVALFFSLVLLAALRFRSRLPDAGSVSLIALLLLFTALFIFITPQPIGPHHVVMIYPFVQILIAWALWESLRWGARVIPRSGRILARTGTVSCAALVLLAPVAVDTGYLKVFKVRGGSGRWSDAIYRLDDYLKRYPQKRYLIMDWGFAPQLLALNGSRIHWEEAFVPTIDSTSMSRKIESLQPYLINPEDLFIFHTPGLETYPITEPFQNSLAYYGLESKIIKEFSQRDGKVIYFVCRVEHAELELHRKLGNFFYFREGEDYDSCSRAGLDFKPTASRKHTLGNYWGSKASDFAIYRWSAPRNLRNADLGICFALDAAGAVPVEVDLDKNRAGTLELEPTGGYGLEAGDWKQVELHLGNMEAGEHEIRFQALEAGHPVNIDYFYVTEGSFAYPPPAPIKGDNAGIQLYQDVAGFIDRADVRVEVESPELVAGKSAIRFRVENLDASAIDVLYTLDGQYMPIVRDWKLDGSHTASTFIDGNTKKGLYVFKAIRDSHPGSPAGWIHVDVPVRVK